MLGSFMRHVGHVKIDVTHFYPEKFKRKIDAEKYSAKGTCEVSLELDTVEIEVKNITYRIDHEGKVMLKPPFRIHSNKKAGIKPKLVPSVVFSDPMIWPQVEGKIKEELFKMKETHASAPNRQLDFWDEHFNEGG
ncbi:MAG: hypothetical protein H6615_10005 [Ignavibacteria bacterium]|nr:hypothetical protein [Ignavibacteria bacterium]